MTSPDEKTVSSDLTFHYRANMRRDKDKISRRSIENAKKITSEERRRT